MKKILALITLLILCSFSLFAQWQPDVRLSDFPFSSRVNNPVGRNIAAAGSFVHAVWDDNRHGLEREIYYKRSTDDGVTWETDVRLTNDPASSELSCIAVSGQFVYVVWYDLRSGSGEIYYKRSTDGGTNWGTDIQLSNTAGLSRNPKITVSGSNVHVVWTDNSDGNDEIYYKNSIDGGENWGANIRLTNNAASSSRPSVSVSGSVVNVVWVDSRDGNNEIYYKRSTDGGTSWGADIRLTNNSSFKLCVSIVVSGSASHVFWYDQRDGNNEIYYKRSTDEGVNWEGDIRLTNDPDGSVTPSATVSGLTVHVVWDRNSDIHYKSSTDGGVNWSADLRLMNNSGFSQYPSVEVSGTIVHVLWEDFRDGQGSEIYYKNNPTGNPTDVENIDSEVPEEFILGQNYPNPFNPTTRISWQSPVGSYQTLKIYDVLGNEVAILVDKYNPAGSYEVVFRGENLTSGIYFYTLNAGVFKQTKKLVLIK